jgi:hypothetical protein
MNDVEGSDLSRQLRRWGPLGLIAVIVIVVGVVLATGGDDDEGNGDTVAAGDVTGSSDTDDTTDDTVTPGDAAPDAGGGETSGAETDDPFADGIVSWEEAEAAGITADIDWGARCDTTTGRLAYPDFFAPGCVAPFTGNNGGETYPGVTADTIKIVVYLAPDADPIMDFITGPINNDDTADEIFETYQGQVEFRSSYFELYGREIELIRYDATGTSADEIAAIADAETIARDIRPFMVWRQPAIAFEVFAETLAANNVICMCGNGGPSARENAPYLHTITKSPEQSRVLLAEYIGKRLAGRDAVHSPDFAEQERVFGYLYLETSDDSTRTAEGFRDRLRDEWGVELATMIPYSLDPATLQEQATIKIAALKEAGVTSIVFAGDPIAPRDFTLAATDQEYFPEWILSGTVLVDTNAFARTYDQQQWRNAFGMSNTSARVARDKSGFFFLYQWFTGEEPPAADTIGVMWEPALTFPLLQGLGPALTPENYMAGLLASEPTARGALTQPSISFGSKGVWPEELEPDYNGIDDVSEIWWDPDTEGVDELGRVGSGVYWWVSGGQRYLPGEWPDTEPDVFNPDNAVFFYDERPASETPPSYPSPAG